MTTTTVTRKAKKKKKITECKIFQYADDTTLFLDGSKFLTLSLFGSFETLAKYRI